MIFGKPGSLEEITAFSVFSTYSKHFKKNLFQTKSKSNALFQGPSQNPDIPTVKWQHTVTLLKIPVGGITDVNEQVTFISSIY